MGSCRDQSTEACNICSMAERKKVGVQAGALVTVVRRVTVLWQLWAD